MVLSQLLWSTWDRSNRWKSRLNSTSVKHSSSISLSCFLRGSNYKPISRVNLHRSRSKQVITKDIIILCGYEFSTYALSSATVRLSNLWTPPYLVAEQLEPSLLMHIFSQWILICWNICHLAAYGRKLDHSFHSRFSFLGMEMSYTYWIDITLLFHRLMKREAYPLNPTTRDLRRRVSDHKSWWHQDTLGVTSMRRNERLRKGDRWWLCEVYRWP